MRGDGAFSVAEACRSVGHSIFVTPKGHFLCEGRRTPDESRTLDALRWGSFMAFPLTCGGGLRDSVHFRADSFEYTLAEIGRGWSKTSRPIQLELADSYAQFAEIHLCQSGVVR